MNSNNGNRNTNFAQQQLASNRSIRVAPGWINAGVSQNNGYNRDYATGQFAIRTYHDVNCKKCKDAEE